MVVLGLQQMHFNIVWFQYFLLLFFLLMFVLLFFVNMFLFFMLILFVVCMFFKKFIIFFCLYVICNVWCLICLFWFICVWPTCKLSICGWKFEVKEFFLDLWLFFNNILWRHFCTRVFSSTIFLHYASCEKWVIICIIVVNVCNCFHCWHYLEVKRKNIILAKLESM
jgi:hypothetical protein